ncbi:MAG: right-handed parallel beta-helix repeat-containing protein [Ruminococcaceae bacterium]|nr:right-handed parallel beta-helix repeat-containing protein [Oscillospiraceae bacterium]
MFDFEKGRKKIAELDALEEKRINEIRNTESDLSGVTGKHIYVSVSEGNDSNDGLSEDTPLYSIRKATMTALPGDAVLLRRGDLFRTPFMAKPGVTYSAYGKGEKPIIYGSPKNGACPDDWFLVYENKETGALIWQYRNTHMTDVGAIFFNDCEGWGRKELPACDGARFVYAKDKSREYDFTVSLDEDLKYFHAANSIVCGKEIDAAASTGPLYLRCDNGNPGKVFNSIEFNPKVHGIKIGGDNITIDNICIKYCGAHGISAGNVKNFTVRNCEIGWIGGSIQSYNANGTSGNFATRYGNGVEVYGSCDGYVIDNCYIYQCYDAGVTHQYSYLSRSNCRMDHIRYTNCILTDSVYNIEYFLGLVEGFDRGGKDILFKNTMCRRAGYGFGSDRPNGHNQENIRSGTAGVTNNPFTDYRIENCVFDRSVYENVQINTPFEESLPKMSGNIYIQGVGNKFCYFGTTSKNTDEDTENVVKDMMGDKDGEVYFVENIPYYQYDYKVNSKVPVTDEDRVVKEDFEVPEKEESREILPPFYIRSMNNGDLYYSKRDCEDITECLEGDMKYAHIIPVCHKSFMLLDCIGLPETPITDRKVYIKLLARSNRPLESAVKLHTMTDVYGIKGGSGAGSATENGKGNGEWEEIIIKITAGADSASFRQIHLYFAGTINGTALFDENGKPLYPDAYFDVAAWAPFPNLESAKNFRLIDNI